MNKRVLLSAFAVTFFGWNVLAAAAPRHTLEALEKEIAGKWAKINTMSAKMIMTADMVSEGGTSKTNSTGTYECRRTGDKMAYRVESNYTMVNNFGGNEMKMESSATSICDGDSIYVLTEQMGQKMATKMRAEQSKPMDATTTLQTLRERHDLKVLPDETIDGRKVHTIEATARNAASSSMPRMVLYIAEDTGLLVKTVSFDKDGREVSVVTFTDIKINEDIPAARFVFTAPEGVVVTDMTATTD